MIKMLRRAGFYGQLLTGSVVACIEMFSGKVVTDRDVNAAQFRRFESA